MNNVITEQSDWDDLLDFIAEGSVTPVLGIEMYKYLENDNLLPADGFLSKQILAFNKVTDLQTSELNIAVNFLENEKKQKTMDIIKRLKSIVNEMNFDFPLLNEFLQIKDFKYFVNTAVYYSILEKKILELRNEKATPVNFSITEEVKDTPDMENLSEPVVFNVFGSLHNTIDPALSDEDLLEFTGSFSQKISTAINIKNALSSKNLLFIGCNFPEWMMRFIIRTLSYEPMHNWGTNRRIIIINDNTDFKKELFGVLKNYDVITYEGSTYDFVKELHQRWKKRNPQEIKPKEIFLSYTRADSEAVETLKKSIEGIGNITCWYDKRELKPGDNWQKEIAKNISRADLFMPLISANSLEHEDGYVQVEWLLGRNFCYAFKTENEKFLIPIVIDEVELYGEKIAKHFDKNINIVKVPKGAPDSEFLNNIKHILQLD